MGHTARPLPTLTFKVTTEEARQIRWAARGQWLSVSEFLRRKAMDVPEAPSKIPRRTCLQTQAVLFAPCPDLPPLDSQAVRDLLGDFP